MRRSVFTLDAFERGSVSGPPAEDFSFTKEDMEALNSSELLREAVAITPDQQQQPRWRQIIGVLNGVHSGVQVASSKWRESQRGSSDHGPLKALQPFQDILERVGIPNGTAPAVAPEATAAHIAAVALKLEELMEELKGVDEEGAAKKSGSGGTGEQEAGLVKRWLSGPINSLQQQVLKHASM